MKILADENIPYVAEAFASLGEVRTLSGRAMTPDAVKDADVLLVRSVTKVDEKLLGASKVKFVGTATIGTDHIDLAFLADKGIAFSAAPGSNANSVAEYVTASLLVLARERKFPLHGKTIGVVGVGNVGSRVVAKSRALGMNVLMVDPPRADAQREKGVGSLLCAAPCGPTGKRLPTPFSPDTPEEFITLDELLEAKPDVVTLHVPLEKATKYPTFHLADAGFFQRLRPGAIFFNTCRGGVHDTSSLHQVIDSAKLAGVVLDTWENEPRIDVELLKKVNIGTPHIAGYSFDGKVEGTRMIYLAACKRFGLKESWTPRLPEAQRARLTIDAAGLSAEDLLREAVLTVYDIESDDARMRALTSLPAEEVGKAFDKLRKDYLTRREFYNTTIDLRNAPAEIAPTLKGLGFKVVM